MRSSRVRPKLSIPFVTTALALWFLLLDNRSFWTALWRIVNSHSAHGVLVMGSLFVVLALLISVLLSLVLFAKTTKPVLIFLLMATSVVTYYMDEYGTLFDKGMMRNVFATDAAEIRDLLSWKLALYVLVLGILPSALTCWISIDYRRSWRGLLRRLGWTVGSALAAAAIVILFYQDYASIIRNHREIRHLLAPSNYLSATYSVLRARYSQPKKFRTLGEDARQTVRQPPATMPALTIIVVGEAARAANFSLGGYSRQTNPLLAQDAIIYYSNAASCGTDTATSVPCMFSNLGRAGYSQDLAEHQENLLDVLQRAGIAVLWRDNNSGCKSVCRGVPHQDVSQSNNAELCANGECYDEILLDNLQEYIDGLTRDAVIVLHQKGSHGPAYYRRYPDKFSIFKPVCQTNQLEKCSRESIVNGYDNTIRYSDYVLDRIIALLKRNADRFDASLIYMSDHGESLGENNLYLHGLPRMIAPEEQTHIPFFVWISEGALRHHGLDRQCLEAHRDVAYSHDNLFHSVLGLMDVQTKIYQPELDLFRPCSQSNPTAKN